MNNNVNTITGLLTQPFTNHYKKYRLTINNPAINIPVPSVFWYELQSSFKFPGFEDIFLSGGAVYVDVLMAL